MTAGRNSASDLNGAATEHAAADDLVRKVRLHALIRVLDQALLADPHRQHRQRRLQPRDVRVDHAAVEGELAFGHAGGDAAEVVEDAAELFDLRANDVAAPGRRLPARRMIVMVTSEDR